MQQIMEKTRSDFSVQIEQADTDQLLDKEWLLANRRGSYASGTVLGCNTRRYHGVLVASLRPPVERVVTVGNLLEKLTIDGRGYELSCFEFSDSLHPQGYRYLRRFWQDVGVHFHYAIAGVELVKSIYLDYAEDLTAVCYQVKAASGPFELEVAPMVALRDFHSLQSSSTALSLEQDRDMVTVHSLDPHGPLVHMACSAGQFDRRADWWYAMHYRQESRRGQQDYEDIWAPGAFRGTLKQSDRMVLFIRAAGGLERPGPMDCDLDGIVERLQDRDEQLIAQAACRDGHQESLVRAADQFIVRRQISDGKQSASILAGYHWFADWGRDTFISLAGLLLETGRFDEAEEVLATFGEVVDDGMIPNRFDDYGGEIHYNSVDASLWYIQAAYRYWLISGDDEGFFGRFRPILEAIVGSYQSGTRFGIGAEADGLISAGDAETQLTWMDARCNDVSFTPRYGKAVEINALWYNALCIMAETAADEDEQSRYLDRAERLAASFRQLFWNSNEECLYDCILPDGRLDSAVRPNQIFAVSLPFSPLDSDQQKMVVDIVERDLLTPYGLRSLSPRDSRYQGHYIGDQFQRDSAYHQGTVWAWLIGPFIEAFLKVNADSEKSRAAAEKMLSPLLEHLGNDGCLGSVSEIFDGDWPHHSKGCIAQAWSVAELLRAIRLVRRT